MSSIASPKRTEPGLLAQAFPAARVATVTAAVLFTTIIMSFRPFQPAGAEVQGEGGGDIVNRLGFSALGGLSLLALVCLVDPRVLRIFFSPWWLLVLAVLGISVMHAADPSAAARGAFFTVIGILTLVAVLALLAKNMARGNWRDGSARSLAVNVTTPNPKKAKNVSATLATMSPNGG